MLRILFIASALTLSLLAGCSKNSGVQAPVTPQIANLGAVELTYGTPSRHDLGNGLVCILKARELTPGTCSLVASLEKAGKEVNSCNAGMTALNQPVTVDLGIVKVNMTLQPK
jgi:hypothetical protein